MARGERPQAEFVGGTLQYNTKAKYSRHPQVRPRLIKPSHVLTDQVSVSHYQLVCHEPARYKSLHVVIQSRRQSCELLHAIRLCKVIVFF